VTHDGQTWHPRRIHGVNFTHPVKDLQVSMLSSTIHYFGNEYYGQEHVTRHLQGAGEGGDACRATKLMSCDIFLDGNIEQKCFLPRPTHIRSF